MSETPKVIHEFVIDRKTWYRGKSRGSMLLREDGRKCCVGFYAESCGVPSNKLVFKGTIADLVNTWPELTVKFPHNFRDSSAYNNLKHLYTTNDNTLLDESTRERLITEAFAQKGIKVTFIN